MSRVESKKARQTLLPSLVVQNREKGRLRARGAGERKTRLSALQGRGGGVLSLMSASNREKPVVVITRAVVRSYVWEGVLVTSPPSPTRRESPFGDEKKNQAEFPSREIGRERFRDTSLVVWPIDRN